MIKRLKSKLIPLLFLCVIVLIGFGWRLGTGIAVHSDDVCMIFVGQDWMEGNIFLKNWHLSTGTFGLPAFELTLLTMLFGYHDIIVYLTAALNYALLICGVFLITSAYAKRIKWNSEKNIKFWEYPLTIVLIIIVPREQMLLNAGTQVLAYTASIIALYVTCYATAIMQKRSLRWIWGIFLGFIAITNSMFLYTACVPIFTTGILMVYLKEKRHFKLVELGGVSLAFYLIFGKLWVFFRGASLGGLSTTFTTREKIWGNLVGTFCNILEIYGVNFWGENIFSVHTVSAIVGFFVLVKLSIEICRKIRGGGIGDSLLFDMLLLMAIVNVGAYAFSYLAENGGGLHLLEPFLLGYTMAGGLAWLDNIQAKEQPDKQKEFLFLILSFLLMVCLWPNFTLKKPDNSAKWQAAEYLVENGYEKGFATFWSAASVMYEAKGNLTISPVSCYSKDGAEISKVHAYRWMNKEEWIMQKGNFLITDSSSETGFGLNETGIYDTFGPWSEHHIFGDINIYIWDECVNLE